ncbi:Mu transposase domain-containing protein [Belnapia sp. F-4-1]|uniref:Mu transposase domain-containing protein n=1 Tax=Belnapia sp. F-4-1 TaxID=1545443 RepID=UPI0038CD49AC
MLELPAEPYEYADWRRCRVGLDYHVEVLGHWYSVPHRLARAVVDARVTERGVELFHNGSRVAAHVRSPLRHRHTTIPEHMPSAHRRHADWTPARLRREAATIGPATAGMVEAILRAKPHPEQGFRACLGILSLPGTRLRRGPGRGRLPAWSRHRSPQLRIDRFHLGQRPRPRLCGRTRAGHAAHPAPEHPRRRLLPLRRNHADPPHQRRSAQPWLGRHGAGARGAETSAGPGGPRLRGAPGPAGRARGHRA